MKEKAWMSWSTGKDSAYALSLLLQDPKYDITGIFTTITDTFNRVSMHSVREELLEQQALNLGIPLHKIRIPFPCSNEFYEEKMRDLIKKSLTCGVMAMAFGDLFLEDIKKYRNKNFKGTGIKPLFPIWGLNTKALSRKMITSGFRAVITCIDEKKLDPEFSGRKYDKQFLNALPPSIDPCGENGEFHSFVYDCPMFSKAINISVGEKTSRDGFTFTDIVCLEKA